jgi:hypothetical protein
MSDQPDDDPGPFVIDPNAVYKPRHLAEGLGMPLSGVLRAIRAAELRSSRRRGRTWILGAWVLQWLEGGERPRRKAAGKSNGDNGR